MLQLDYLRKELGMDQDVKINILAVDDDRDLCIDIVNALEGTRKYHCYIALTIADAIEKLKTQSFDVLSADWRFGEYDSGWLMIPTARQSNPWIAILVHSMYPELREAALAVGVNSFVLKALSVDGKYTSTLNETILSSLKKNLVDLFIESVDGERCLLAISSPLTGGEVVCPVNKMKQMLDVVSKLQLLDKDLEFVELLRFNKISELMSRPEPVFILCFIKDFGPLSLSDLQKDVQLPNNGVEEYGKTFLAAGLVESIEDKLRLTIEGEFYLSAFDSLKK